MSREIAFLLIAVSLAAGVGTGWLLRSKKTANPEAERRVEVLERQVAELQKKLVAAAGKEPTLEGTPPPPPPAPTPPPPTVPPPGASAAMEGSAAGTAEAAKAGPASEPRYLPLGSEDAMKAVDWSVVGKNMAEMAPLITKFAQELATTGKFTPETVGRVQQLNGPLVTAALKAAEKMGTKNPNVAFTHPAFMANAIAAALEAAGKPMTEAQAEAVGKAADDFTAKEARRLSSYGEGAFALEKALDESALREDFFARVFAQLTAEQRDVLQPPATRGRLQADLFSAGLVWLTRSRVLPYKNREGLLADMEGQVVRNTAMPDDRRPAAHEAVVEWLNSIPAAEFETPVDALSLQGMVPVPTVVTAATRELTLLRRLVEVGALDAAGAEKIRGIDFVLVPVRRE